MNIVHLLNQIKSEEIVLPAIQRDFVWPIAKIEMLFDSVMRGYPVGIVLMWETHKEIQFRRFEREFRKGNRPAFYDNNAHRKLRVVLDGQQRLQSLYLALFGQYDNDFLYFNVLSGIASDDFEEQKYEFTFESPQRVKEWNKKATETIADEDTVPEYYISVRDLFTLSVNDKLAEKRRITSTLSLDDDDQVRLDTNLAKFDEVLTKDQNILKASIIDENKTADSPDRQTESDVLEIFVRINRQGTPLSRSDLIFSMLKLNWKESATALPDFIEDVNTGNSFNIEIDFVIRCLYAVSDLGTKFNIDLLRKKSNMEMLKANFPTCCNAIRAAIDNVQQHCSISSSKLLGGDENLVPIVYYLFHVPNHELPNNQVEAFRKSLFLLGFSSPFSRYGDSRLAKFIREELQPSQADGDTTFPFQELVYWVDYWENLSEWDERLVQQNPRLALHLVQGQSGNKSHYKLNTREMDHIFPRSILYEKHFDQAEINHFANQWILPKGKNINKSNKHPKKYLAEVSDAELSRALIDRNQLDYRQFRSFIRNRASRIMNALETKTGLSRNDFK
ncbi:DUF262 domain-containing protein [Stratiformator vulcanicus]|uniref:GmrSD restriction endonucleases N-terminal domain-containing protein n=1 Tax=Stratiformator vulcanicus TaxID=2527980 RepID=A0A517R6B2_9PLAN|nr:DUF262 domain-containing protein [Stratiformator vulcanicus]QDT39410.1 hypothetical protein Pan189_38170 [Stratiformator vulcanicus]